MASVKAGSPAAQVLKPGDELVAVDGKRPPATTCATRAASIAKQIATHRGTTNGPGCRATGPA